MTPPAHVNPVSKNDPLRILQQAVDGAKRQGERIGRRGVFDADRRYAREQKSDSGHLLLFVIKRRGHRTNQNLGIDQRGVVLSTFR